jgi:uncharacterized membrane protein YhaH (DUF805 family)
MGMDWNYLLTGFDGRIGRKPFWIALLIVVAAEIVAHIVAYRIEGERLSAIVDLAFAYPEFAILAKRAHDRDIPTWVPGLFFAVSVFLDFLTILGFGGTAEAPSMISLIIGVPWMALGLALLIDLGFRQGVVGPNRYGPDPLEGQQ